MRDYDGSELDEMGWAQRGKKVELDAGMNLAGKVKGIDDIRYIEGKDDAAFVTQFKSIDRKDAKGFVDGVRSAARDLYDKSSRWMCGQDKNGDYREFDPDHVAGKGLAIGIPENHLDDLSLPWVRKALDQIAESTETIIRVVPISKWRSSKRR